jgi:hypothetical protein
MFKLWNVLKSEGAAGIITKLFGNKCALKINTENSEATLLRLLCEPRHLNAILWACCYQRKCG